MINYSHSGNIFRNLNKIDGNKICQSNLGNLQSQLLQFDKSIYHLALSLQDEQLKKFLKRNLLNKISNMLFNKISAFLKLSPEQIL